MIAYLSFPFTPSGWPRGAPSDSLCIPPLLRRIRGPLELGTSPHAIPAKQKK